MGSGTYAPSPGKNIRKSLCCLSYTCKKRSYVFYSCHVFTFFYFPNGHSHLTHIAYYYLFIFVDLAIIDIIEATLEVNWPDHISNNEVRRQVQREWTVMDTIRQRKLQLFGHICKMLDDRLLKSLTFGMVEGERRPGRPVRRWIDDILMWCGKDVQEAMMMTVVRDNWRRFVASNYGPC